MRKPLIFQAFFSFRKQRNKHLAQSGLLSATVLGDTKKKEIKNMKKLKWVLIDRSVTPSRVSEHEEKDSALIAYREYIRRLDDIRDIGYIDVRSEIFEEKENGI